MTHKTQITSTQTPRNDLDVHKVRELVDDLFDPIASIFWADFLLSATVGWSGFISACLAKPLSWQMGVAMTISVIGLYRALVFIHELTHLRAKALLGFAEVWNLLVGIPLLFPSFLYLGVHSDHHRLSAYGTIHDPEYLPFAGSRAAVIGFIAHSLLLPALLLLRFLVLSPLGLLVPPFHRLLEKHASSLSMNIAYCRQLSTAERFNMVVVEVLMLGLWSAPIVLVLQGTLPWRVFALWYGISACIALSNALRTLGSHRYRSSGKPGTLVNQLTDSVNAPGTRWSIIWTPVGLRYHALHHFFPSIPYHNLPIAHQRLIQALPPDSPYRDANSPSLWHSLRTLWCDRSDHDEV